MPKSNTKRAPRIAGTSSPGAFRLGAAARRSNGTPGVGFLLIVMSLGMAIVCFGVASGPGTFMARRAAGDFMVRHRVDLTALGLGLLGAAAFAMLWNGGF
jgi:hypothetical protein